MQNLLFLAATATEQTGEAPNQLMVILVNMLPIVLMLVVFYFLLIRPNRKKEKETAEMRKNIEIGDEITTVGGIVGIVVKKTEDTVVIETGGDRSKIRVKLWAVQSNETIHDAPEA